MFDFLKRKKQEALYAPVDGQFIPLTDVADPVFSQKMMGEGFGIQPTSAEIYAPVKGAVTTIFQTKHAIGITSSSGKEVLIHIGLDTVELAGKPFTIHVQVGQAVDEHTRLVSVDFEEIRLANKDQVVLVLITNDGENLDSLSKGVVHQGEQLNNGE